MDYFYFREYDTQRSFGTTNRLRLEVPLAHLVPFVAGEYTNTRQRTGYEIDARARRTLMGGRAGVDLLLGGRTRVRAVAGVGAEPVLVWRHIPGRRRWASASIEMRRCSDCRYAAT